MVTPVFHRQRPVALFAATSHIADVGGLGFGPDGTQVFEEGINLPIGYLFRKGAPNETLLEEIDGPILVAIGNWLAESLDASELENEQVLLLHLILERCSKVLWRMFPEVLAPLALRALARLEEDDDED